MTYVPSIPATINTLDELREHLERELREISRSLHDMTEVELRPRNAAPTRPRDGMVVYADGTTWNPGAGVGVYGRVGGAWVKL